MNKNTERMVSSATRFKSFGTILLFASLNRAVSYDKSLEQQRLEINEDKWDLTYAGGCGYTMKFRRSCFCMPEYLGPFLVVVSADDEVANAIYLEGSSGELAGTYTATEEMNLITISDAFDEIQKALEQNASDLTVIYNQEMGYPSSVSIDWEFMIADEETYFTIANVTLL